MHSPNTEQIAEISKKEGDTFSNRTRQRVLESGSKSLKKERKMDGASSRGGQLQATPEKVEAGGAAMGGTGRKEGEPEVTDEDENDLNMSDLEVLNPQNEINAAKMGIGQESYLHLLKNMKKEDIRNNTEKRVDFSEQLSSLKKRTEMDLPYTMTQINDAIYLDQYSLLSFEYHCYQNDVRYQKLRRLDDRIDKRGVLVDSNGNPVHNLLRTQEYQRTQPPHPMSAFDRNGIRNYEDTGEDLVQEQRTLTDKADFMTIDNNLLDDQFSIDIKLANENRKKMQEANP